MRRFASSVACVSAWACEEADKGADSGAPSEALEISGVQVAESALLPNVVTVSWTSSLPGSSAVEWGEDGSFGQSTPTIEGAATAHAVTVLGLPLGAALTLRPVTVDAWGRRAEGEPVSLAVDAGPELPAIAVEGDPDDGRAVLLSVGTSERWYQLIVDRAGRVLWYVVGEDDRLSTSSLLSRDGRAVLYNTYPLALLEPSGTVERVELDGSSATSIAAPGLHHDFVELPDGTYAYLSGAVEEWAGEGTLGDEIRVTDGETTRAVWSAWDTLTPYAMCSHYGPVGYAEDNIDWTHANSLRYDEAQDRFWLLSRNLDALFSIDAATGAIDWQLGGDDSDFALVGDDPGFDHAHLSDVDAEGMGVFDNGLHRDPPQSRALAYAIDEDARTATLTWTLDSDAFDETLGDVRRLDDGYLVAWAEQGTVTEVDEDGVARWTLTLPEGYRVGHVTRIDDLYEGR